MTTTSTKTKTTAKKTPTWNSTYAAKARRTPRIDHSKAVTQLDRLARGVPSGDRYALAGARWSFFFMSPVPSLAGQEMVAANTDSPCSSSAIPSKVRPSTVDTAR